MKKSIILSLIRKEILIEWRQKHLLYGGLLYMMSTVFAIYTLNHQPEAKTWNILFWITQLFITVNTVAKSFLQESQQRYRYYFTIVPPTYFLLAKFIYNIFLMLVMSVISFFVFTFLLDNPLQQPYLFLTLVMLGSLSLSTVFTFLSAIAARAQQNASLMAILGIPIVIPLLMILSKLALKAIGPIYQEGWWNMALILLSMDFLVILLGCILFPFIWQE